MPTATAEEVDFQHFHSQMKSISDPLAALASLVSDGKRADFLRCMQLKFILLKLPSIGAPCTDDGGGDESIENVV